MSTYTQLTYQIVFSTKNRRPVLEKEKRDDLFKYIWGVLKNKNCHLYRINGVKDHLHIITHIHPTQSVAGLVKDVKVQAETLFKGKIYLQDLKAGSPAMRHLLIKLMQ